jgi:glycosyltransferase involved in cell wall biosynthesis
MFSMAAILAGGGCIAFPIDITVAICTYNRARLLERTLAAMTRMSIPQDTRWELIVVNNNSNDATDSVIESFAQSLPIRHLFEARQGISHARNCAIGAATGDYIVWTDDDVIVGTGWLSAYVDAFRRRPDAAIFGGNVFPEFEGGTPKWISESFHLPLVGWSFAYRNFGDAPHEITAAGGPRPFGANCAVRLPEQRAHLYDTRFGLGTGRTGEETMVIDAILGEGHIGYWVPKAAVKHWIPRERQALNALGRCCAAHGETGEYSALLQKPYAGPLIFGVPRWLWRRVSVNALKYWTSRVFCSPSIWVRHYMAFGIDKGALQFWWTRRRGNGGAGAMPH